MLKPAPPRRLPSTTAAKLPRKRLRPTPNLSTTSPRAPYTQRDIIGRYYFDRMSLLEDFVLTGPVREGDYVIRFTDLAVGRGYANAKDRRYRISVAGAPGYRESAIPEMTITEKELQLSSGNPAMTIGANSLRAGSGGWRRPVRLDLRQSTTGGGMQLKGITR